VSEIPAQQQLPFFGQFLAIETGADLVKPPAEEVVDFQFTVAEFRSNPLQKGMDFVFGKSHNPAEILMERWSLMTRKGRASTCVGSGSKVTVLRLTSICFIG